MSLDITRPNNNNNKTKKKTGFIVKMQLNNNNRGGGNKRNIFVFFFFFRNYYTWILWFFLSFYLFTSYFAGEDQSSSPSTIRLLSNHKTSSSLPSRALIESSALTTTSIDMFSGMKIYVYDLPASYNEDWVKSSERCSTHLFAAEVAIHRALLSSVVRTLNPEEADYFFVPVYVSCNFSTSNGFPSLSHARSLISSAVDLISVRHPFWNRTQGSDHVFVASHDFGACFHAMEDMAIEEGIPEFMKKSIILQTFGVNYKHPCQEVEHVIIPPYIPPESVERALERAPANGRRDIWAFFRGKMEVNPKNISGRFYSKGVRTAILKKYGGRRRFHLNRHRFVGYRSEIVRSVFCLCPLGWAPWSPRLVESAVLGCVPVVIADGIKLPFSDTVQWPEISLTVAEKDVKNLRKILEHVAVTNLSAIQRNLHEPEIKRALLYNVPMKEGDATWRVLEVLRRKLDDRSYRRSRVLSK